MSADLDSLYDSNVPAHEIRTDESDPVYEAAEAEHLKRDHIMWLCGFTTPASEVTRAQLRAAEPGDLRQVAEQVFGFSHPRASRSAMISFILAHRGDFPWT